MRRPRDADPAGRRAKATASWLRLTAAASSAVLLGTLGLAGTSFAAPVRAASDAVPHTPETPQTPAARLAALADDSSSSCHMGNGIKHVVEITFDNVHYFRDNPNVPSDLEMLPNLLNFLEGNGTFLANNHTPLIAHTADDILTTLTGLYGDRQGMPVSNDYEVYNKNGPNGSFDTTDNAGSFAYWTDSVNYGGTLPAGGDTNPNMVYSPVPPATAKTPVTPDTITPAPWVPFTRAGCNVGEVATANSELENTTPDIADAFGPNSPEAKQLANDPDPYKDPETADYIGIAVHCAQNNAFCTYAQARKYGQDSPSSTAVPDVLPDEPGGYNGFQALFGHKYVAPQLGAGTKNLYHDGYQVTNAAGNLVDLNGNQINGSFLTDYPGFPGYGNINASQTLAYMADMLESGVPVVTGYLSDLHGNFGYGPGYSVPQLESVCKNAGSALGSGTPCYLAQAKYYNAAFGAFLKRLAADGITPANTLFIVSSDEGDHEAGANVGRAIQPTPANCNGVTVVCSYPTGTFGELDGNVTGLLKVQKNNTTPFGMEYDTAPEYYINGDPGPDAAVTRTFERDVAGLKADNPYAGRTQLIANYLADPTEEAILHMVNADPARTPTFAEFAKPDYYLEQGSATCNDSVTGTNDSTSDCVTVDDAYAWDHGDYAAEINTNYVGFVGPGVKHLGLDGLPPNEGPNSAGPNSGQKVVSDSGTTGTWVDETDIRPTLMYLTGLTDDYEHDGRVITQILADPNRALSGPGVAALGACYKQLNSSVGQFANYTLQADTAAVESNTPGDAEYLAADKLLAGLEKVRDALALKIKGELEAAAFQDLPIFGAQLQTGACQAVIVTAAALAHKF
jgi:hypothetical protein